MTALAADRLTPTKDALQFEFPVAAATTIYAGSLVVLDSSGNLEPASTATGKIAVGRADEYVANAGAAAAKTCKVRSGCFRWVNGSTITKAHIGDQAYAVDDQTVSNVAASKSAVGVIVDVDTDGVWVLTVGPLLAASTGLLAANNLSDVGTAATARTNLGLGTISTQAASAVAITGGTVTGITDLAVADGGTGASTAEAARTALGLANKHVVQAYIPAGKLAAAGAYRALAVAPVAGTISNIYSVLLGGAITGADATLTGKINGTGITTGVITITQAGSAIADKDTCAPSALNVVAAGDVLEVLVGGGNTEGTNSAAMVSFEITEG